MYPGKSSFCVPKWDLKGTVLKDMLYAKMALFCGAGGDSRHARA
jgi:hypothetical protein